MGTPLNAILGNVELMLDGSAGPLSKEAWTCLGEIQAAGRDLLRQSKVLLLLVQALKALRPEKEEAIALDTIFEHALRQTALGPAPDRLRGTTNVEIVGDPFWLTTLARCVADVYAASHPAGPLELGFEAPAQVRIVWSNFCFTAVPATAVDLIQRIVELHGGRMHGPISDAFVLSWPEQRLRVPENR